MFEIKCAKTLLSSRFSGPVQSPLFMKDVWGDGWKGMYCTLFFSSLSCCRNLVVAVVDEVRWPNCHLWRSYSMQKEKKSDLPCGPNELSRKGSLGSTHWTTGFRQQEHRINKSGKLYQNEHLLQKNHFLY